MHQHLWVYLTIVASIAVGCQSGPPDSAPDTDATRPQVGSPHPDKPAAYLNGQAVTRDTLYRLMVEANGGQALAEVLLDRAISKRLADQGIALTDDDLSAERDSLLSSLSDDADQAARLLNEMREQRGLGKTRFDSLLRRSAGLRRMVSDGITVSEPSVRQAYEVRHGVRYRVRLITADAVNTLSQARRSVLDGASFADVAVAISTDPSVSQGGLLSPISPADATYPKAVRDALPKLSMENRASRLSPIIALPEGYALLWLEGVIDADGRPYEQVRDELERAVRLELERVRMQQLARVLIEQANVIVLDPALEASWQRQRDAVTRP